MFVKSLKNFQTFLTSHTVTTRGLDDNAAVTGALMKVTDIFILQEFKSQRGVRTTGNKFTAAGDDRRVRNTSVVRGKRRC